MKETKAFTIALPAGRLAEEALSFFKTAGLAQFESVPEGRRLSFWDKEKIFQVFLVRSQDVPTYVLQGGADAGITGRDVFLEGAYDLTVPFQLGFGKCRLAVASLPDMSAHLFQRPHLRVATKYPRLAADFFYRSGLSCEIIKLHGSVEIAPILSLADCIVDIVSTGNTLRENGLVEVCTIMDSYAVLIVNRSAYALHTERLSKVFAKFQNSLASAEK